MQSRMFPRTPFKASDRHLIELALTHLEESAIRPLPHGQAHRFPLTVSVSQYAISSIHSLFCPV